MTDFSYFYLSAPTGVGGLLPPSQRECGGGEKMEEKLLEILAGVVNHTLDHQQINGFDFNNEEEKKEYEKFIESIKENGYKLIAKSEKSGSWGHSCIYLYENTTAHSPSEKEPTYYLIEECANDTGDCGANVYAIF